MINNYSTINLSSTLNKESKTSLLSKSTKSILKQNLKKSKKNLIKDKDNIINQIFSTMRINNIKKENNKSIINPKDYLNTIYKNTRTGSKISTIKLINK